MRRNTLNQLLMSIISLRSSQSSIAQSATKTLSPKAYLTVIVKEYMNTFASMEDVICHLIVVKSQKCISKLNKDIKGRSTFTCKLCDGSFSKKEDFQDHMTLSHSILCTECDLRFVSNLQRSFHRNATHNANARMGAKVANNYKSFSVPDPPKRHKGHRTYSEMQEKMNPVNRDPIKCTIKECTCH